LTQSDRSLEFDLAALEDLAWWVQKDRKKALRILRLVQETAADLPIKDDLAAKHRQLNACVEQFKWCDT
jgi:Txe/YoeB family toxin of Txe-Axe toxin-antitoxin module